MDEFDIVPSSEDYFFRDGKEITIDDYIHGIDNILQEIEKTGDMEIGLDVAKSLVSSVMAHGKALAKLLYGMNQLWKSEKDFVEYVSEFVHIKPLTIERYMNAWSAYESIPEEYQPKFLNRPMKDLNALGAAISQGYEIDNWEKLANAINNNEFLRVIRDDVKGTEPRKNSLMLYLEETGDIVAWMGGERVNVGYLNIQDLDEVGPVLTKAVNRIINSAGIVKH